MRHDLDVSLPRNRRLRWTVARLLISVPTLSLMACSGGDDPLPCVPYDAHTRVLTYTGNMPDGRVPTNENCAEVCQQRVGPGSTFKSCEVGDEAYTNPDGTSGVLKKTLCSYDIAAGCTVVSDGRHPEGLRAPRFEARCSLGDLFARMAWLEAASVPAFLRLADELKAHGAPEVLIRAARRSAGEEVRHARAIKALAQRHGASVPEVEIAPFTARSLEAMVLENAREGCVRETYGAVVAGWQARTAQDAQVREEFARVAGDELRHAELAWAVEAWAAERLTPAERRRVSEARMEAFRELERLVEQDEPEAVLIQQAGLPSRDSALHLVRGLQTLVA